MTLLPVRGNAPADVDVDRNLPVSKRAADKQIVVRIPWTK